MRYQAGQIGLSRIAFSTVAIASSAFLFHTSMPHKSLTPPGAFDYCLRQALVTGELEMSTSNTFARLQGQKDCRVCFTLIGFVYTPLVLMLGAAAVIGLG